MANGDQGRDERPFLQMRGIVKVFPGARALDGVDLDVVAGEVHCLLGQNGAGKSTLIRVLSGAHQPTEGDVVIDGSPVTIGDPVHALKLGVATMYQELDVVDGLTVAENVYLGHELAGFGVLRRSTARRETARLLERLGHSEISPDTEVGSLPAAGRQIVAMARALSHQARVIVMDEPTAVLDAEEVENLFRVVAEVTAQGIAIIYISHRLEEIRRIGDRITVLKNGATVARNLPVAETPTHELIRLMTGRDLGIVFPERPGVPADAPVLLEAEGLGLEGVFSEVDLTVRSGEIVGLAGLVGSGRSEILETIYGARRSSAGTVRVDGETVRRGSTSAAVAAGMGLAPEERKSQGLILDEPIYRNVTLPSFPRFAHAGVVSETSERAAATRETTAVRLDPPGVTRPVRTLSGGNQQKVMLARWLVQGCRVLLLDEPTRGVDVGARAEIYTLIRRLADAGTAVVVVSSEIPEVLGLADRVLVIADGTVLRSAAAHELTEHDVLDTIMKGSPA
ncbi:MAG: sugar ABC transporter ATP-binding protein [Propionibacteriaceae bacterium]|jgi:ribose transport system ATP-binding protein|nr:sugar ABC transporter ATP-binding protein [Propionibacteriaceae bacterium]